MDPVSFRASERSTPHDIRRRWEFHKFRQIQTSVMYVHVHVHTTSPYIAVRVQLLAIGSSGV